MALEKFFERRRREIELDGGVKALVRCVDTREAFRASGMLPGIDKVDGLNAAKVADEMIKLGLISLDGEIDPIGRGLIQITDLTRDDREAILDVMTNFIPSRGKGADEAGVPLGSTGSAEAQPDSSTVSPKDTA